MASQKRIDEITKTIASAFPTFGGDRKPNCFNPLTHWMEDRPAMFAMGVDVRRVVAMVLTLNERAQRRKRKGAK